MPLFERPLFVDGLASAPAQTARRRAAAKNGFALTQPPVLGSNEQIFGVDEQVSGRRQCEAARSLPFNRVECFVIGTTLPRPADPVYRNS